MAKLSYCEICIDWKLIDSHGIVVICYAVDFPLQDSQLRFAQLHRFPTGTLNFLEIISCENTGNCLCTFDSTRIQNYRNEHFIRINKWFYLVKWKKLQQNEVMTLRKQVIFLSFFLSLIFSLEAQTTSSAHMVCSSISAVQSEINKIDLSWNIPENFSAASVAIYRANRPVNSLSVLSSIKPVAELPASITNYTDTVTHFDDYYYALISRDRDGKLHYFFFPAVNITVNPVKIRKPEGYAENFFEDDSEEEELGYQAGHLRGLPLPYLSFSDDFVKEPNKLDVKAVRAGHELAGKYASQKPRILPVYIFEEDLVCASGGDDYYLFQSLKTYFIKKDYKNSVLDLKKFLSMNRSPQTTNRALFYLAESQYYNRNYRQALSIFLYLEDEYPQLTKKWIDSALDNYRIPDTDS